MRKRTAREHIGSPRTTTEWTRRPWKRLHLISGSNRLPTAYFLIRARAKMLQSLVAVPVIVEMPSTVSVTDFSTSLPDDGNVSANLSVLFLPRALYTSGWNSILSPFHCPL